MCMTKQREIVLECKHKQAIDRTYLSFMMYVHKPYGPKNNFVQSYYHIVASTSPSRIEAHAGIFRSLMKGIFDPYVL